MLRRLVSVSAIVLLGIIATAGPARAEPLGNPLRVLAGKNTLTGKCTSLNGSPVNGAKLVTWSCDNGTDQRWHGDYRWVGGSYKMTLRDWTNKCVGLANRGSTANGTELVLWDCHYQSDQIWFWEDRGIVNGVHAYAIRNQGSGKCIGLANLGSVANGTRHVLWDCHYHADQLFY